MSAKFQSISRNCRTIHMFNIYVGCTEFGMRPCGGQADSVSTFLCIVIKLSSDQNAENRYDFHNR